MGMRKIPNKWVEQVYRTRLSRIRTTSLGVDSRLCQGHMKGPRVALFVWLVAMGMALPLSIPGEGIGLGLTVAKTQRLSETQVTIVYHLQAVSGRASSSMVGTIMALLATFDEAGILPPEGTASANQVIHGLIQLQSALMKSPSPALATYRMAAIAHWENRHNEITGAITERQGLTARLLSALIGYDQEHSLWEDQAIASAMQDFNVTQADWQFVVDLFSKAEASFHDQGRSIYQVYEEWRVKMPMGT